MAGKGHHLADFFSTLALSLLTSTVVVRPAAGDMCDGLGIELPHEEVVALACPLDVNIFDTKHSIVIKIYSKDVKKPEDVLGCDWLSSSKKFDCLRSRVDASLIRIEPDRVLARLTKDSLKNGTYRCQLVPPTHNPFLTDCDICDPVKENPTTQRSVIPSTADDHHGSNRPREKPCVGADGHHGDPVTVVLSIIVLCQLLAMAAMVGFFLWYRRRMNWKKHMGGNRNTSSSTESSGTLKVNFSPLMPSEAISSLEEDKSRMSNTVNCNLYPKINRV